MAARLELIMRNTMSREVAGVGCILGHQILVLSFTCHILLLMNDLVFLSVMQYNTLYNL